MKSVQRQRTLIGPEYHVLSLLDADIAACSHSHSSYKAPIVDEDDNNDNGNDNALEGKGGQDKENEKKKEKHGHIHMTHQEVFKTFDPDEAEERRALAAGLGDKQVLSGAKQDRMRKKRYSDSNSRRTRVKTNSVFLGGQSEAFAGMY